MVLDIRQLHWSQTTYPWESRLQAILSSWEGTPYGERQCAKKAAVDCVRFTCSVYDELDRVDSRDHIKLPQDQALHSPRTAIRTMLQIRRLYMPNYPVTDGVIEPADMLVMKYIGGGPGHAIIAGTGGFLWQTLRRVSKSGIIVPPGMELVRIYRAENREQRWLK